MFIFSCPVFKLLAADQNVPRKPKSHIEFPHEFFNDALDEIWPEEYVFDPADTAYWSALFDNALHEQDLETLAELSPYAHEAYNYAVSIPLLKPVADWIKPRLDYFELAEAAVRQVTPAFGAPTPPPQKPQSHALPQHKPPPKHTLLPPKPSIPFIQAKRRQAVRNPENWRKKLTGRKPTKNAKDLVPQLKDIFKQEGLPPELVWIAEVESSLNPQAKSPAGALGLFQLMPTTARQYGLSVEKPDDRLDPSKSARAAAKCLKDLHGRFYSWPLALAAYNSGAGRVSKAMKNAGSNTFEGIADLLPLETQMYVPKIQAMILLRENVDLARLPPPA